MAGRNHKVIATLALAAAFTLLPPCAWAFSLSCPWGTCPKKEKPVFDDTTRNVLWQVSHNPSLMNVEYLKYFIGRPENEKQQRGQQRHYYWYGANRQPIHELIQSEGAPGQVVESTMITSLEGTGLTFDQLHKIFGNESRRFFDYYGHPNELFSFSPNTYLSFGSAPNSFRLNQATVMYRGEPLPPPPAEEMQMAQTAMIERAENASAANGKAYSKTKPGKKQKPNKDPNAVADSELLPLLIARVKSQPLDAQSHLMLAQALQHQAHLNEAVSEYKIALSLSGDNQDVRNQSIQALKDMMLFADEDPQPRRNLEIVDNGQHMRVVGNEKKSQKQTDDPGN